MVPAQCLRDLPATRLGRIRDPPPPSRRAGHQGDHPKNSSRPRPVGRVLFALAMTIFTKLAKPEKMAWMFDYRVDWDATTVAPVLQTA